MSQWHGGKGDKNRVSDIQAYNVNYDKIFRKPKPSSYKLFLDDYRNPQDAYLYDSNCTLLEASSTTKLDWYVVRSYKEFKEIIERKGVPDVVSFDNDLNNSHMKAYMEACKINHYEWENLSETGLHCASFLVNYCRNLGHKFPKYYVHTANHLARPIFKRIING